MPCAQGQQRLLPPQQAPSNASTRSVAMRPASVCHARIASLSTLNARSRHQSARRLRQNKKTRTGGSLTLHPETILTMAVNAETTAVSSSPRPSPLKRRLAPTWSIHLRFRCLTYLLAMESTTLLPAACHPHRIQTNTKSNSRFTMALTASI